MPDAALGHAYEIGQLQATIASVSRIVDSLSEAVSELRDAMHEERDASRQERDAILRKIDSIEASLTADRARAAGKADGMRAGQKVGIGAALMILIYGAGSGAVDLWRALLGLLR